MIVISKEFNMAFIEKLKATLVGIFIACAMLIGLGFANEALNGRYSLDTDGFEAVVEWGGDVSIAGLTLSDNRTLGFYSFKVEPDMIVRVDDTDTAGEKELVIGHGGKEYIVVFHVKYKVTFVSDGAIVQTQLVTDMSEIQIPDAPSSKTGYLFSHWDIDTSAELGSSIEVNAVFTEVEYPSLDGLTATYGDTIGTIELGSNEYGYWEFVDAPETPVGNAGAAEHLVRFVFYGDPTVNKYDYATVQVAKQEYVFGEILDSFYYDGEVHTPSIDGIETIYAGAANILPGVYSYSLEIVDDNYFGVYEGTYEILKPTVTVTVSSATIAYPSAVPTFTYTVDGFSNVDLLGIRISAPEFATQIGEYEIGITYINENVNYIVHKGTLTVIKGDLEIPTPEISKATFEDKLSDIQFLGSYLGTWSWENPEIVIDDINGIVAYAIFTHDDPNLNPVRMAIEIKNISKKILSFNVLVSEYTYAPGTERLISYEIAGGRYPELYASLAVSGNTPEIGAGDYMKRLVIDDPRYEGSIDVVLTIAKATPVVDFGTVYETVWQENLRLEAIALLDGFSWQNPTYKITEAGDSKYTAVYTPVDTDNYITVTGEITVKVAKAPLSITGILDAYTKTYDTLAFDIAGSGILAYYTDGELTVKYYKNGVEIDSIVNAGEYTVLISVSEGKNYLGATIERPVSVSRAENTETVLTEQNAVYLDSLTILVLPEGVEGVWSWLETDLGAAGTKTLTAVFTPDANANYLARAATVTVHVARKTLTPPTLTTTLAYNGKVQTLGIANTDLYEVDDLGGKNVGSYTAILTLIDKDNYQWQGGNDTFTVSYTVIPVDNSFTYLPDDGLTFPYLSSLEALLATAKLGGVKIEYKRVGASGSEYSETAPTNVGAYNVRYTTLDTNCTTILTEIRTFSITPIEVIPAPSIVDTTLEYNGEKQTAALRDTVNGIYTVTDTGATNAGDIGTVTLTIYDANYVWANGTAVLTLTYEIVKAENYWRTEPSISGEITYGDELVYQGEAGYDNIVAYHRPVGSNEAFVLGLPTDAGEYEVMFTTVSVNALKAEERYATVTIKKRELAIPSANGSLVYNGNMQVGVASPSAIDSYYGIYTVDGGSAMNSGSYTATATITDPNYKWLGTDSVSVEIGYTVAKAQGVITLDRPSYSFTYSGDNYFEDVKNAGANNEGECEIVYTVTSFTKHDGTTVTVNGIVGAGTYVITVSTEESANYLAATATITVTVDKISLSIPALSDKVYTGSPISVEIADTDEYTVSGDLSATNVGNYTVTFTLTDPDNYEWLGTESMVSVSRGYKISTAVNAWSKEPVSISTVYNGKPVLVDAVALHGTVSIVYTLGGEVVDAPVGAGVYNVTVTATADNYSELVAYVTVTIAKATVDIPTHGALTYNGKEQSLSIPASALYTVIAEASATNAGEAASVTLKLLDAANYKWDNTTGDTVTVSVTISKASAELSGAPITSDWTCGDGQTLPVSSIIDAQKEFPGISVTILYALSEDGELLTYAQLPKTNGLLNAGTYYAKAVVYASNNWDGTESELVCFTVLKQTLEIPTALNTGLIFSGASYNSGIVSTELYTVVDEGGSEAGTYHAYITLTDSVNYEWRGAASATADVSYEIGRLVLSDDDILGGDETAEYGDTLDLGATVTVELVGVDLSEYISYSYSFDGNVWYDSIEALSEALGTDMLGAGSYLVKTTLAQTNNWQGYERTDRFEITKKKLSSPTPAPLTYNGTERTALASSSLYTVEGGSAILVGGYTATVTLADPDNYEWNEAEGASIEVSYTVAKAQNAFSTTPALSASTVTYKDGYTVVGASLYDTLKYKYRSTGDDDYTLIDSLSELPTAAGSYEIVLYTDSVNAEPISATLYLTINRKSVTKPSALSTFVYDGTEKTHGITPTEGCVIRSSKSATNAGDTVFVTLGLLDSNYVWSDGTTADITLSATVNKATVTFSSLSVHRLTYTQLPAPTVKVDKEFATSLVSFVYSVDKVNYYDLSELKVGGYLPAGDYWVKACASGANVAYSESAPASFTVSRATPDAITVSWGNSPSEGGLYYKNLLKLSAQGTSVTYGGVAVEIASYTYEMKGSFAGDATVYTVIAKPKDIDNFDNASFDITVPLKTVATIGHGGTPYGSIEDALTSASSGNSVWVIPDVSGYVKIVTNVEVKTGVTLILPYGSGSSDYNKNNSTDVTNNQALARNDEKLCVTKVHIAENVTLTVKGTLIVSGQISAGNVHQMYVGHTYGNHARLILEDGASVYASGTASNKAVVRVLGFIYDADNAIGSVVMDIYAEMQQSIVLRDYRNGGYLSSIYDYKDTYLFSPFTRFQCVNVETLMVYKYGSALLGTLNINTSLGGVKQAEGKLISSEMSGDGVIIMTDKEYSSVNVKYDRVTDVASIDVYGGARTGALDLSVSALGSNMNMSTEDGVFPISYHFNIALHKAKDQPTDAQYSMDQVFKMLPGSVLTVNAGTVLTVNTLSLYETFDESVYRIDDGTYYATHKYPTNKAPARLNLYGTLIADYIGGNVYTDGDGALLIVNKSTSVVTHEVTEYIDSSLSSRLVDCVAVTNTLKLYYGDTLVRNQVIINIEYTSSASERTWLFDPPEIVEVTLGDGYGIKTDFAVLYDENGMYLGTYTFDSSLSKDNPEKIMVLKGSPITFYLTKNQLFSDKAVSSITVSSINDIHTTDYTVTWSAGSGSPIVYNVRSLELTGDALGSLTSVSFVYNTSTGNISVTLKSENGLVSSGTKFKVNGVTATGSGALLWKTYTYTATITADTVLNVVKA